jgi:hypothetical protein
MQPGQEQCRHGSGSNNSHPGEVDCVGAKRSDLDARGACMSEQLRLTR